MTRISKGAAARAAKVGQFPRYRWLPIAAVRRTVTLADPATGTPLKDPLTGLAVRVRQWAHPYYWLMRKHLPRSKYEHRGMDEGSPAWRRAQHAA